MPPRRSALVPGGAAALAGIACLAAAGFLLEEGARTLGAWVWLPYALAVAALACFVLAGIQGRHAKSRVAARPVTRSGLRPTLILFHVGLVAFGALLGFGAYLLHQRNTGPHAAVTVTHCEVIDPGPRPSSAPHEYCRGDWTLDGRTYVDKTVQGADLADEGHVIDATVHGDTAYSRDLQTPLILLGVFGTATLLALGGCVTAWRRWWRAPRA